MRYKRQEILRYDFKEMIPAYFKVVNHNEESAYPSQGSGQIVNISAGGLLLATSFKLPAKRNIQLFLETTILHHTLHFISEIVWTKQVGTTYHYGLRFLDDHHDEVIKVLKEYQKQQNPL
ncbi:PilZ domain-containing protein [Halobacillus ihumii]|uniref:PilZ domain-containing protein n=1 Tax=Halobacillus ihumii TaxID=2686092 RepID=UPI0013D6077B|nr:PilZ domain-containing protein [Halobacillus ihumii]